MPETENATRGRCRSNPGAGPISYTIPDAIAATGIGRTNLYRLAKDGRIIFRKIGRRTLIDGASLRAFIAGLPVVELAKEAVS